MTRARLGMGSVVVLATVLALAGPALGEATRVVDGNDTRGVLDLKEVGFRADARPLRWTFRTFARWTIPQLWDRGYLVVSLDTRGDPQPDARILVRSDGRSLVATFSRLRGDGREVGRRSVRSGKPGGRQVWVEVGFHRLPLGPARASYSWWASSLFTGPACRRTCLDLVPDRGAIEQPLPTPSPSPTETPSPTPSPSPTETPSP